MPRLLQISRLGHPVLRAPCEPVPPEEILRPAFQEFVDDMIATMRENRGVGLAAPQVFVSRQVAVIEHLPRPKGSDEPETPLTVLINPEVTPVGNDVEEDWEGCLSIDDLRGIVPRWCKVNVKALGRDGKKIGLKAQGFFARVIQHECDHLAGVLYFDRMTSLKSLMHLTEFHRHAQQFEAPRRRKA